MTGMTMAKIAITIPQDTLKRARSATRRARTTLSAYIANAVDQQVQLDDLDLLLEEMRRERGDGPMTPARRRAAELALHGPKPTRKRS